MIHSLAFVMLLLIFGDAIAERFSLPVPGAALALAGFFVFFSIRGEPGQGSKKLFDLAAPWFPLFFVPAAVGVLAHLSLFSAAWLHVAVAIFFGTALVLVTTGQLAQALLALGAKRNPDA